MNTDSLNSIILDTLQTSRTGIRPAWAARLSRLFIVATVAALAALYGKVATAAPPPNDDIANAVVVTEPLPFTHSVSTVEATLAADDPLAYCAEDGFTVWYVYRPLASGYIIADTTGSDYDTVLTAYTGTPGDLTVVACNDDDPSLAPQSKVWVKVDGGVTYYIRAGAYAYSEAPGGNLIMNLRPSRPLTVVEATVDSVTVNPAKGSAVVRVRVQASSPIVLGFIRTFLVQSTGRGSVAGQNGAAVFESGTSFVTDILVQDSFMDRPYLRDHATGFSGGPAQLTFSLSYSDDLVSSGYVSKQLSVVLKGSGNRL